MLIILKVVAKEFTEDVVSAAHISSTPIRQFILSVGSAKSCVRRWIHIAGQTEDPCMQIVLR